MRRDTVAQYQRYLARFPEGPHRVEAQARMTAVKARHDDRWRQLSSFVGGLDKYKEEYGRFARDFPDSRHLKEAKETLDEMRNDEVQRLLEQATFAAEVRDQDKFHPPFYFVSAEGARCSLADPPSKWSKPFLVNKHQTHTIETARTMVVSRVSRNAVGRYVTSAGNDSGQKGENIAVELCLIDVHDPSRRRAMSGMSTPERVLGGSGGVRHYIDGERVESDKQLHHMESALFLTLLDRILAE